MFKAKCFGIRIIPFLLCVLLIAGIASPASAAMVDLDLELMDRLVANIYYDSSARSTVIGCLEDGTALTVTGEDDGFYRIDCFGMKGYIPREQVRQDEHGFYYVNCPEDSELTRTLRVCTAEDAETLRQEVVATGKSLLGIRYRFGGSSPSGFDCSGFVWYVYRQIGYSTKRTANALMSEGIIVDPAELQPGDLVFFHSTSGGGKIASHIGIHIGDGLFIHAGNDGICINDLNSNYYTSKFLCARRVILTGSAAYDSIPNATYSRRSGPQGRSYLFFQNIS